MTVAVLLAAVSAILVKPDEGYAKYIDYQTLALLFCLMVVMAQFQRLDVFQLCRLLLPFSSWRGW